MRISALVTCCTLLMLNSPDAAAQPAPEDAARSVLAAFERGDWDAVVGAVDPDAIATFREQELALLAAWLEQRDAMRASRDAGERSFGYSSDGVLRPEQIVHLRSVRVQVFPGAPTFGALVALSPAAFFRQWLEAAHDPPPGGELASDARVRRRVLGAVVEGDSLAHVLYRLEGEGHQYEQAWTVEVLALRRSAGVWRMLLPNQDFAWGVSLMHRLRESDDG